MGQILGGIIVSFVTAICGLFGVSLAVLFGLDYWRNIVHSREYYNQAALYYKEKRARLPSPVSNTATDVIASSK
jgi:hypothetical protein